MYRAPEFVDLYMREELTEKSDLWALGCILYTLVFLEHPFQNQGSLAILNDNLKVPASDLGVGGELLLRRLMDQDPEARPTVEQAFEATKSLAQGRPVEEIPFTEEALVRKEERRQRAIRRENKRKTKIVQVVAPRDVVDQGTESVAARRLRLAGGASNSAPVPAPAPVSDQSFDFQADFSNVSSNSNPQRRRSNENISLFDDAFGSSAPAPAASAGTFDAFGSPAPPQAPSQEMFDVFAAPPPASVLSGTFDAFESSTSASASAPASVGADAVFDAFAASPAPPTMSTSEPPAPERTFSAFSEFGSPEPAAVDDGIFAGFDTSGPSAPAAPVPTSTAPHTPKPMQPPVQTAPSADFDMFTPGAPNVPKPANSEMDMLFGASLPVARPVEASSSGSGSNAHVVAAVAAASLFGRVDVLTPQQTPRRRSSGGNVGYQRNSITGLEPAFEVGMNMSPQPSPGGGGGFGAFGGASPLAGMPPVGNMGLMRGNNSQLGTNNRGGSMGPMGMGSGVVSPGMAMGAGNARVLTSASHGGTASGLGGARASADPFSDLNAFS